MHRYLARRLLIMVPILFGITLMSYGIMALTPGDPVQMLISPGMSAEDMAIRRKDYGLDRPVYVRYTKWLGQLVRGNLSIGRSQGAWHAGKGHPGSPIRPKYPARNPFTAHRQGANAEVPG